MKHNAILLFAALVAAFSLPASAEDVVLVNAADVPSVAARTDCVQQQLLDVRTAVDKALREAKKGRVLLVKTARALEPDDLLNDALDHFADGQVRVCRPEETMAAMTRLAGEARRPSTAVLASKWTNESWRNRCIAKQAEIAANANRVFDLVMFGDSITHNFERNDAWGVYAQYGGFGLPVWQEAFKDYKALDIGIGGDRTQDLLWRGLNGDLDNYFARVITVMIGTNNVRSNSPEEIAEGVRAVVELVKTKHPESKILLYAIFPRGENPTDGLRVKNEKANAIIKTFADGKTVVWRDINAKFLEPGGTLTREMMPDFLHPTPKGYRIWADDILPFLAEARAKPIGAKGLVPVETGIAKLAAIDAAVRARDAWKPTKGPVVPCAPNLHAGRLNYFAHIRGEIAKLGGEADLVLFGQNKATGLGFEGLKTLSIGVGETVEQVPWNALTGDFDGYAAKWIAVGIDQSHDTKDFLTSDALRQTVEIIRKKQPKAKVIVLASAPGGQDANDEMRRFILRHNAWAKALCDGQNVFWCDYSEGFYLNDGTMNPEMLKGEFNFTDKAKAQLKAAILDTMAGKPPAFPTAPAPGYDATRLTLMHYNIHSGWGKDGSKWNLWDPVAVIKKVRPDVCTLNEVTWGGAAKGFQVDQPTIMGHILNPMWRVALGRAQTRPDGCDYGNAILHCEESLAEKVLPLPSSSDNAYKEPRAFVAVEFPNYWVGTAHFPFGDEAQLTSVGIVAKWAAEQKKPVFFTGDWNAQPTAKCIAAVREHFTILSDTSKFTFCTTRPHATIDYIAVDKAHADKVTVESFNVLDEVEGSDHFPLVMKLLVRE